MAPATNDEKLSEALALLSEVRDYMLRLPAVPVTAAMVTKVDRFLTRPSNAFLAAHQAPRVGFYILPSGLDLLEVEVTKDTVSIKAPDHTFTQQWHTPGLPLLKGFKVRLTPI